MVSSVEKEVGLMAWGFQPGPFERVTLALRRTDINLDRCLATNCWPIRHADDQ
jgi:hypothetical protein